MSNRDEKNQSAKPKVKQNEQRSQNPMQQGKQQPGNRPQDNKGSLREDSVAQFRSNESERPFQGRGNSESDRSSGSHSDRSDSFDR